MGVSFGIFEDVMMRSARSGWCEEGRGAARDREPSARRERLVYSKTLSTSVGRLASSPPTLSLVFLRLFSFLFL